MHCVGSKSSGGEEKAIFCFICIAILSNLSCSLKKQIASLKENGQLLAQKCLWAMFWREMIASDIFRTSQVVGTISWNFSIEVRRTLKGNRSLKCKEYTANVPDYCSSGVFPRLLRGGVLFKYLFRRKCSPLMQERFPFPFYSVAVLVYFG